jgi:hypothetical protein
MIGGVGSSMGGWVGPSVGGGGVGVGDGEASAARSRVGARAAAPARPMPAWRMARRETGGTDTSRLLAIWDDPTDRDERGLPAIARTDDRDRA